MEKLEDKVPQVLLECLVLRDQEAQEDLKVVVVLKEALECLEQKVKREELELMDLQGQLVYLVQLDHLEIEELLVCQDQLDLLDPEEQQVLRVSVEILEK